MTAVQLLANAVIQPCAFGELLVYQGNALTGADLEVVVHAIAPTTSAEHAPPARHPARLAAIQSAARMAGLDLFGLPIETEEAA